MPLPPAIQIKVGEGLDPPGDFGTKSHTRGDHRYFPPENPKLLHNYGGRVKNPPLQKGKVVEMYLSIGNDMAVRDRSIIGIFDLDNTSTSRRTREFLEKAEREGEVVPCDDLPKSFVLTSEYGFHRVRLTSLNSYTLEKRLK